MYLKPRGLDRLAPSDAADACIGFTSSSAPTAFLFVLDYNVIIAANYKQRNWVIKTKF